MAGFKKILHNGKKFKNSGGIIQAGSLAAYEIAFNDFLNNFSIRKTYYHKKDFFRFNSQFPRKPRLGTQAFKLNICCEAFRAGNHEATKAITAEVSTTRIKSVGTSFTGK